MAINCRICGFETDKEKELVPYEGDDSTPSAFKEVIKSELGEFLVCLPCWYALNGIR